METEERGQKLKSVIQFQGQTIRGTDFTAEAALAIHESVKKQPILEEIEGKYRIGYIDSVDVEWANICNYRTCGC